MHIFLIHATEHERELLRLIPTMPVLNFHRLPHSGLFLQEKRYICPERFGACNSVSDHGVTAHNNNLIMIVYTVEACRSLSVKTHHTPQNLASDIIMP